MRPLGRPLSPRLNNAVPTTVIDPSPDPWLGSPALANTKSSSQNDDSSENVLYRRIHCALRTTESDARHRLLKLGGWPTHFSVPTDHVAYVWAYRDFPADMM